MQKYSILFTTIMESLGEKIITLKLFARNACFNASGNGKTAIGLKDHLLLLLSTGGMSPIEIMNTLLIDKSNVTHLCASLLEENLIARFSSTQDRRQIEYRITEKGIQNIRQKVDKITELFNNVLTTDAEREAAITNFDETLRLLSFL